jgi:hypothetical protein
MGLVWYCFVEEILEPGFAATVIVCIVISLTDFVGLNN